MSVTGKIKDACSCLFCCLVFAFLSSAIITARRTQKVYNTNANLNRFEFTTGSTTSLSYNLTFSMSIHNSAWYDIPDYHDMKFECYYNTEQFDSIQVGDFMLKPGRTRNFNFTRWGNSTVNLGNSTIDAFRKSNETRFFALEIWLQGIRVYAGEDGESHEHLTYKCKLNLQLMTSQNSSTQGIFQPVKCR